MTTTPKNPEKLPNSFMRDLACTLDDDELKVRSQDLATAVDEKITVEVEKKEANENWNGQIKDLNAHIIDLALVVRTRTEIRPVECVKDVDLENRETTIVRRDTGEGIETRGATTKELETASQRNMFSTHGQEMDPPKI